jgi:hypothetical protein
MAARLKSGYGSSTEFSSSTGTTTSSFVGFGLLNYILPFIPILDAVSPVFDILNPQVCHNIIFPSILGLPRIRIDIGFQL